MTLTLILIGLVLLLIGAIALVVRSNRQKDKALGRELARVEAYKKSAQRNTRLTNTYQDIDKRIEEKRDGQIKLSKKDKLARANNRRSLK
jgi:predicted Holliday junction resolvase-like endonuclease